MPRMAQEPNEYQEKMRIAVEKRVQTATVEAEKQEQEHKEETTIALENTTKKATVPTALVDRLLSLAFS